MSFLSLPGYAWVEIVAYLTILTLAVKPLGTYIAKVFSGETVFLTPLLAPLEQSLYRLGGIDPKQEMSAAFYARCVFLFSALSFLSLFGLLYFQEFPEITFDQAFNMAASYVTNTNWQAVSPETTFNQTTQMIGLAVQNFFSPAVGLTVMAALIRGFTRRKDGTIGNFWVDLVRGLLYLLLPLAFLFALFLLSQGVVQTFADVVTISGLEDHQAQALPLGPVASQVSIKMLGTNGGGYFAANAAHPFENPTPLSNFVQLLTILLIPAAVTYSFGRMVGKTSEGWSLFIAMMLLFVPCLLACVILEQNGNPALTKFGLQQLLGNMEGKELRFGSIGSGLWATATTAASNGSTNAALDSFLPLAGMVPLLLIQFGEVIFGGVGSGLYGMLVFVLITVFIAGLMIGRTPEYLGKKIGVFDIKMASLVIILPAAAALGGAALTILIEEGRAGATNPYAQGFSQILYAFSSAANNNGSAFAGILADHPYYNVMLGLMMLIGRFSVIFPVLAIAGSLSAKNHTPTSVGTLRTDQPIFVFLLVSIIILVGVLTYVPALSLGPIAEHLHLSSLRQVAL